MPVDVTSNLREALAKLVAEKRRIERQVAVVQSAIRSVSDVNVNHRAGLPVATRGTKGRRRRMSPAARKAVSARMKAYWAKRKGRTSRGKGTAA